MTPTKQPKKAYSEKTYLGNPIPRVSGTGPMACRLKLSSAVLAASDLGAGYEVELLATPGEITIRKIAEPAPSVWSQPRPKRPNLIDELNEYSRRRDKDQPVDETKEPLSDAQLDGEAL